MKSITYITIVLPIFLQAITLPQNPLLYEEQRKIYEEQQKELQAKTSVYTELKAIPLTKDETTSQTCIQLKSIEVQHVSRIDQTVLNEITKPYLGRCDTMHDINTLIKKINNLYIKKAYVTSRAYIKPQDLSKGHLVITVMEGKVELVQGKDIYTDLVFLSMEDEVLNLRDLETAIEQLNRLQSMQATMQINPGSQEGYSKILVTGKQVDSVIHGSLGINNYGTSKSGKYQFMGTIGWDNPLGINDLLTFNLNTTDKHNNENNSIGNSISYGFPIGRSYLEFIYSRFDYDQIVNGLNVDYLSSGENETFQIKLEYKLFHTKTQKGKLDFSFLRKRNDNYLAGVYLDTSSNTLTILQLSYTHNFSAPTWDGYATLRYNRGLDWLGAKTGSSADTTFDKYTLNLNYNKRINTESLLIFYNFSFYGQYAKKGIVGSEQIGIGGPYSVRGFRNEDQISGNKGFYIRNELSFLKRYTKGTVNPYLGFDYGVVSHNEESYGGHMAGITVGSRFQFYDLSLDLFHSMPIIDSNKIIYTSNEEEVRKAKKSFTGFSLSYRF